MSINPVNGNLNCENANIKGKLSVEGPIFAKNPSNLLEFASPCQFGTDVTVLGTLNFNTNNVNARGLFANNGASSVSTYAAAVPTVGQVLTATSGSAATWQTPGGGASLQTYPFVAYDAYADTSVITDLSSNFTVTSTDQLIIYIHSYSITLAPGIVQNYLSMYLNAGPGVITGAGTCSLKFVPPIVVDHPLPASWNQYCIGVEASLGVNTYPMIGNWYMNSGLSFDAIVAGTKTNTIVFNTLNYNWITAL
jgi:hypothetical protein